MDFTSTIQCIGEDWILFREQEGYYELFLIVFSELRGLQGNVYYYGTGIKPLKLCKKGTFLPNSAQTPLPDSDYEASLIKD